MTLIRQSSTFAAIFALGIGLACAASEMPQSWPEQGPIPSAAAAIRIAVKLWSPIYGTDHIAHERPYHAALQDGVWTVQGSIPHGARGGAAILKIRKSDGKVLLLTHYK